MLYLYMTLKNQFLSSVIFEMSIVSDIFPIPLILRLTHIDRITIGSPYKELNQHAVKSLLHCFAEQVDADSHLLMAIRRPSLIGAR
ncbi:hypothetical protein SAMN05216412_104246 [Nitrosospira multiformis]|uniref:Uncharacterized protein n=1 Tax=Nitrosospira multiformis TaxID=1231 RepID=A0A1I0D413_9PROT|nr:hypothetical protein SAMN05216412_104246 [Nitrosospira multiformis]